MNYLVINKLDSPFYTNWLMFPNWENDGGDCVCIINLVTRKYIMHYQWKNEADEPDWQEIEEDHL